MAMQVNSLVGRVIGGYRLERIIGSGSTGAVFLGRGVDQSVRAIKVLSPVGMMNALQEADFRQRFNREEQVMRTLRHPNILFVEAFGEDTATGTLYMVMPYIEKGTLAERLDRGPLPFNLTIRFLKQLAAAVDFANDRGIIHRDIKPGNILIDANEHIYLADFGIVKIFETRTGHPTTAGTLVGTPEYMAPEQARGERVTRTADIYSVGMVAYHMLTGHMAFQSPNLTALLMQIAQNAPPPPRSWRPEMPEEAQAALLRCLAKQPNQRFTTATQFVEALDRGLQAPMTANRAVPGLSLNPSPVPPIPAPLPPPLYNAPAPVSPRNQYIPPPGPPINYPAPAEARPQPYLAPPPRRRGGRGRGAVAGIFIVLVLVVGATLGVMHYHLGLNNLGISQLGQGLSSPTPTPVAFNQLVPGICARDAQWQTGQGTNLQDTDNGYDCSANGLTLYNSGSSGLTEIELKNPLIAQGFTASITISNMTEGCAGIGFTRPVNGYEASVCASGNWTIVHYDTLGYPATPAAQGSVTSGVNHRLTIAVTATTFTLSIDGTQAAKVNRLSGNDADYLDLSYDDSTGLGAGSCLLSHFTYIANAS